MNLTPEPSITVEELIGPSEVVKRFLDALADGDAGAAAALVADDLVYENVSLPTIRGRERFERAFKSYFRYGFTFEVALHRITQDGPTVITERTDAIIRGRVRSQLWVCGVFEVRHGRIVLWRDYFDWFNATAGFLRGLVGAVIPAAKPRFSQRS